MLQTLIDHTRDGRNEEILIKKSLVRDIRIALYVLQNDGDIDEMHPAQWANMRTAIGELLGEEWQWEASGNG